MPITHKRKRKPYVSKRKIDKFFREANLKIEGVFSYIFEEARSLLFPRNINDRDDGKLDDFVNKHIHLKHVHKEGCRVIMRPHGFVPSIDERVFINLRHNRCGASLKAMNHVYVAKSTLGATRTFRGYNISKRIKKSLANEAQLKRYESTCNDFSFVDAIHDPDVYSGSGYGLFANRDFKCNEIIGIYTGKVRKLSTQE